MKRFPQKQYTILYKYFSFFHWQLCCICQKEFKMERGWKALTGPYYGGEGMWRYVCRQCVPTKREADEYFLYGEEDNKWLPPKPIPPPPPPKRKKEISILL